MQLIDAFHWIETMPIVRMIATVPAVYPAVSALHVVGIALLVGSILTVDLRLLGVLGRQIDAALPSLVRMALVGFAITGTTGLLLVSVRIGSYASNPAFLAKMAILAAGISNALLLRVRIGSSDLGRISGTMRGRIAAALSVLLWIGAVFSGRWIAFV